MNKPHPTELNKPKWVCHDEKEIKYFEAWINAKLDEMFEPSKADIEREQDPTNSPIFDKGLLRGRLLLAVRAKDHAAVKRLAGDDVELLKLVIQESNRKPGERIGPRRNLGPRKRRASKQKALRRETYEYPPLVRAALIEADRDVELIKRIFKQVFGKQNRSAAPSALDIAAKRWGFIHKDGSADAKNLINFRKNR